MFDVDFIFIFVEQFSKRKVKEITISSVPFIIDNELQGTNSSGSLGGLDVRRRIPIKLISKQANKVKPAPRTQRTIRMPAKVPPGDEGNSCIVLSECTS